MATNNLENQVAALEEEKDAALGEVDKKYSGLIEQSDSMFQKQINAVQNYADKQSEIQQAQTDLTVQQLEQQQEQAKKAYTQEQSAAYTDWKKQSDAHGVNAEKIAAGGMWGSGYSESTQTAMYNEYQERVATAKASYDLSVQNFNNALAQARLQNNAALAEIAFNAFTQELELNMQAFNSRNALLEAQASAKAGVQSNYLDVLEQLQEDQYNVKPDTEDAFTKWVTYLQNEYSDGYISDANLWKELTDTYGETALKQAGFSNTAPEESEQTDGVSAEHKAYLEATYPDGYVTDRALWSGLVATYGLAAIQSLGYKFKQTNQGGSASGGGGNRISYRSETGS